MGAPELGSGQLVPAEFQQKLIKKHDWNWNSVVFREIEYHMFLCLTKVHRNLDYTRKMYMTFNVCQSFYSNICEPSLMT